MKRKFGLCLLVLLILSIVISLSSCDPKKECSHDFTDWEITQSATCTTEGIRQRECKLCGVIEEAKVEKNASHDYGEFVAAEENDCLRTDKMIRTCKRCGHEDVAYLLGDHKPGTWVEAKEPTFLEDGCIGHYVCNVCGQNIDRDLKVLGDVVIPKLSSNLSVCLNGEIVAPLKIERSDSYFVKLVTDPINVKAGDVVSICQTDKPSVKYEYTVTFNSTIPDLPVTVRGNINDDGTVRTTSSSVVSLSIDVTDVIKLSMGGYRPDSGVVAVVTHSSFDQPVMIPLEKMDYPGDPDKQAYIFGLFEADKRLSVTSISIVDLDSGKTYGFADLDMAWNTWSFGRGAEGEIMFKDNEADWWLAFDIGGNKKIELHKLTKPSANTGTGMVFTNGDKFSLDKVTLDQDDDKYLFYTFPALDTHLGNRSEYSKYVSGTTLNIERIEIYADAGAKFYLSNSRDSSMAHENLAWVDAPEGTITVDTINGYIEINTKGKYIIDYLPYSMSIFIYCVEETPDHHEHVYVDGKCECGAEDPDHIPVTPDPDLEGIVIEINGIGTEMNFVTYPTDGVTSYLYGYVELKVGDKLLIRDTENGTVWGYDDIDDAFDWNTWDYHEGEDGEIVFDFATRYIIEFNEGGCKKIYISKVFAPFDGESFGVVFDGEREDVIFNSFDLSESAGLEEEFMWTFGDDVTMNNSDFLEYIEANGLWFYYTIIELEAGEKFSLKNYTKDSIIGADYLADITGDITALTRNGDVVEVLKSGIFNIIYVPTFNTFTVDCDTSNETLLYLDGDFIPLEESDGYLTYELTANEFTNIAFYTASFSALPISISEDTPAGIAHTITTEGTTILFFDKAGVYNLRYNVDTGVLHLEIVEGGDDGSSSIDDYYIFLSVVDYTNGNSSLEMSKNPDNPNEVYVRVDVLASGSFIAVSEMVMGGDYTTTSYSTLANTDPSIATGYGELIMVNVDGPIDVYFDFLAKTIRIVPAE